MGRKSLQLYADVVLVSNDSPVLLDHFLNAAIEVDIDAVCDGKHAVIGAICSISTQAGCTLEIPLVLCRPTICHKRCRNEMRDMVKKWPWNWGW